MESAIINHEGYELTEKDFIDSLNILKRSVLSTMLGEDQFYEDEVSIKQRIRDLIPFCTPEDVFQLAMDAREKYHLRHIPLFILNVMCKIDGYNHLVKEGLIRVIQRPDEILKFMSIYWEDGKCPIANSVKKGISECFNKFNEYQLAKYNRPMKIDNERQITLKDVMFMCHAKPKTSVSKYTKEDRKNNVEIPNDDKSILFSKLVNDELAIPDTWEVNLSSSENKKATWERMIDENKLGGLAVLRNIRNFIKEGIDNEKIVKAISNIKSEKILPYRFIAAERAINNYYEEKRSWDEPKIINEVVVKALEEKMLENLENKGELSGHTALIIDVSGSMRSALSSKSDLARLDAANGLAILLNEICEDIDIFTFSNKTIMLPMSEGLQGFALGNMVQNSQRHECTYLRKSLEEIEKFYREVNKRTPKRCIIITDEQSADGIEKPFCENNYIINVASSEYGLNYKEYLHINGFSEVVIDWIMEYEKLEQ